MKATQRAVTVFAAFVTLALALNALTMIYAPDLIPPRLALFADNPRRWESTIEHFEREDARLQPPAGRIVFVGSSTIRHWDLAQSFPDLRDQIVNRGFGGSLLSESAYYADRLVVSHDPRIIVLYAGDNDIASGISPDTVVKEFTEFEQRVHASRPKARIIFISIKPSPGRKPFRTRIDATNEAIREYCAGHPQLTYLDIEPLVLNPDGEPRPELFTRDGVHLGPKGYQIVANVLRPLLVTAE